MKDARATARARQSAASVPSSPNARSAPRSWRRWRWQRPCRHPAACGPADRRANPSGAITASPERKPCRAAHWSPPRHVVLPRGSLRARIGGIVAEVIPRMRHARPSPFCGGGRPPNSPAARAPTPELRHVAHGRVAARVHRDQGADLQPVRGSTAEALPSRPGDCPPCAQPGADYCRVRTRRWRCRPLRRRAHE